MNLKQIGIAIYATYLTNKYGFKLKKVKTYEEKKALRIEYSEILLSKLFYPHSQNYILFLNAFIKSIRKPFLVTPECHQLTL